MKLGMIGVGSIGDKTGPTLMALEEIELYAVASRTIEHAQECAAKYGWQKVYGSYEELLQDPEVELVYVATPHSHHYEHMMMCIDYGKPIICEKSFTMNAAQAKRVQEYAKEKGVYVQEAIWPRFMPSFEIIKDVMDSGIIGNVNMLTANLSYHNCVVPRMSDPYRAGGALLDLGVYCLNFALMFLGENPDKMETSVIMSETGVDAMSSITLHYGNEKMAVLTQSMCSCANGNGMIHGDKGWIEVENFNNPKSISIYGEDGALIRKQDMPEKISGYEYEFLEAVHNVAAGKLESDIMPMDKTVAVMELMDSVRAKWGLVYPQEKE